LETNNYLWEIIIVDNAGDHDTKNICDKYTEMLPLKYLIETKRGKNNALNRAISEAQGRLFVFTDDDVIFEPNWLVEMWEGANRWPGHYIFGGRILPKFPDAKRLPFEHPFLIGAFAIADWNISEGIYKADKVWGPNMAIRASLFKDGWKYNPNIGPDGSNMYVAGSEVDLTRRLEQSGYQAVYLPKSLVYHQIRSEQLSLDYLYDRAFRFGQQFSYEESKVEISMLFGIPRHLIRKICKSYLLFILSFFTIDKKTRFDRRIYFWEKRGRLYWYKKVFLKKLY
jgi:glycosyltransferase involved in cell wall biosynthesis